MSRRRQNRLGVSGDYTSTSARWKRGAMARLDLRNTAPVLDPTGMATRIHGPSSGEDRSRKGRFPVQIPKIQICR